MATVFSVKMTMVMWLTSWTDSAWIALVPMA